MATATVKGFVNDIESMCECTICFVSYDEIKHIPRLLPCQHTLCTECLSKHCKGQKIKCPYCMKEHHVKNGDPSIFPKDNTRRDLKELLEKFSQSLCGICRRHDNVKYFCGTCNIRMCRGCYKERKQNDCNMHDIDIPDDTSMTPDTSLELTESHSKDVCLLPGHENNELKYFCSEISCCKPICANCVAESHNGHAYKSIKERYEDRKKSMQNIRLATLAKITIAKKLLETVENKHLTLTESFHKGIENLSTEANKGIKYINDFEENTKTNTDESLQKNLRVLDRKKEQLQSFIENATECCAISEEALTGNNFITFLSVEKTLTEKLMCFEKSDIDKPLDPVANEDFELEGPILDLRERVERMIRDGKEISPEPNSCQRRWISFWKPLAVPCFNCFASILACLVFLICFLLWYFQIPYTVIFETDDSYLTFQKSQTSLTCHTKDGRILSKKPIENISQMCGNAQTRYIFQGAFTNTTFLYGKKHSILLKAEVTQITTFTPGLILFEFGISKVSIGRRHLLGPPSNNIFGWFLKILNTERKFALINTEGYILYTGVISARGKVSFHFSIEFNTNRTITLKVQSKKDKMYKTLDETQSLQGKSKKGFVKLCDAKDASVIIQILSKDITFNKSTLYPEMYISLNNDSISNTFSPSFTETQFEIGNTFEDIFLGYCRTECVYVMNFRIISPTKNTFSLVLTNSKFLPSAYYNVTLLSYNKCYVTSYTFIKYESFCVYIDTNIQSEPKSVVEMAPNVGHQMAIIVNKKDYSVSFFFGNTGTQLYLKDGFIFESDHPVLRLIMHDMNADVQFRLGNGDELLFLTWFAYKLSPNINKIQSFITSNSMYICLVLGICNSQFIFYLFIDFKNFLKYLYLIITDQDRIYEYEPRIGFARRRRGRRQRNR